MEHIGLYQHGDLLPDSFYTCDCGELGKHICELETARIIVADPSYLEVLRGRNLSAVQKAKQPVSEPPSEAGLASKEVSNA